jgi:hypothetical protein
MRIALVALLLAGTAHADRWSDLRDIQGAAWGHYELTDVHDVEDRAHPSNILLAGLRVHALLGWNPTVGYHVGIDLAAGSTLGRAGFAYDVALFPVGVGVRLGPTSFVAFGAGVGAMGAVGTLDDAVTLPLEATVELGGNRLRVLARARASYVAGAPGRHDGAPSIAFADELEGLLGLRIGHHYQDWGFPSGNGYFGGIAYRELAGSRYVGLAIGYSIDGATERRRER